jgi:hypothetical protein
VSGFPAEKNNARPNSGLHAINSQESLKKNQAVLGGILSHRPIWAVTNTLAAAAYTDVRFRALCKRKLGLLCAF